MGYPITPRFNGDEITADAANVTYKQDRDVSHTTEFRIEHNNTLYSLWINITSIRDKLIVQMNADKSLGWGDYDNMARRITVDTISDVNNAIEQFLADIPKRLSPQANEQLYEQASNWPETTQGPDGTTYVPVGTMSFKDGSMAMVTEIRPCK